MATSMTSHPAAPPPPAKKGDAGTALLVLAGLGAAGAGAWLLLRRQSAAPASAQHFKAGSGNPSLVTQAGRGLPVPGYIPCYGRVATAYPNQGVMTTIGPGPASGIPWNQPLAQTGATIQAPWPSAPGVPGVGSFIPTDFHGCMAAVADITPA